MLDFLYLKYLGAARMAQWVNSLPSKPSYLNSIPRTWGGLEGDLTLSICPLMPCASVGTCVLSQQKEIKTNIFLNTLWKKPLEYGSKWLPMLLIRVLVGVGEHNFSYYALFTLWYRNIPFSRK